MTPTIEDFCDYSSGYEHDAVRAVLQRCFGIVKLAPLPGFHLLSHRLEIPLHPIHANRDAVDERERTLSALQALE